MQFGFTLNGIFTRQRTPDSAFVAQDSFKLVGNSNWQPDNSGQVDKERAARKMPKQHSPRSKIGIPDIAQMHISPLEVFFVAEGHGNHSRPLERCENQKVKIFKW